MKFSIETLQRSAAIVIAAIGAKVGVKVTFGGTGAYTTGDVVNIPAVPDDDPEAPTLAYGYGLHEAAHVRDTDMTVYRQYASQGPLAAAILNILEDVRIEKTITRPYPGAAFMLRDLVKVLVGRGKFAAATSESAPADVLSSWLLHSQRAKHLGQKALEPLAGSDRKLLEATFPAEKVAALDTLLERAFPLKDTEAAGQTMEAILAIFSEDGQEQGQPDQPQGDSGEENDGEGQGEGQGQSQDESDDQGESQGQSQGQGDDQDQDGESDEGSGQNEGEDQGESQGQSQGQDGDSDDQGNSQASSQKGAGGNDGLEADTPVTVTTDVGEMTKEMLEEKVDPYTRSGSLPSIGEDAGDAPHPGAPAEETNVLHPRQAKLASATIATRIRTLLEDETMAHERPREEGPRLMRNRLARVPLGERRVFARKAIKQAPDAAVFLLLDRSGSMGSTGGNGWSDAKHANTACLALAYALEPIKGVTLGVWSFDTRLKPVLLPGQKPGNGRTFNQSPGGGTDTAGAMARVGGELLAQPNRKKILIVITDGEPYSRTATAETGNTLSEEGVAVIGIGIGASGGHAVKGLFSHSFGIESSSQLGQQLAITLRGALQSQPWRTAA